MVKQTQEEKVQQGIERLNQGIMDFFSGEHYREYLACASKFHRYSMRNTVLIASQCPHAGRVAGYRDWQKKFGRQVKKGEKGIMILAPYKRIFEKEVPGELDLNGNPLTKQEVFVTYRPVYVFDESQTEGDPLPDLIKRLDFKVDGYERVKEALIQISECPIIFEPFDEASSTNGFYHPLKNEIHIREGMSEAQTIKTMLHEMAHSLLHRDSLSNKTRNEKEIEAESVAFIVSSFLGDGENGIDTSDYSFGYVASWAEGKELKELTECLENIKTASDILIDKLDQVLQLEMTAEEVGQQKDTEEIRRAMQSRGIRTEGVVIVDRDNERRDLVIYVTNTDGSYGSEYILHGMPEEIERVLTDQEAVITDFPAYMQEHDISCRWREPTQGQIYDYWFNYETRQLQKYPEAAEGDIHALVITTDTKGEELCAVLNDAVPLIGQNRVSLSSEPVFQSVDYTDELKIYPEPQADASWPMVYTLYTNVPGVDYRDRNIYEFQRMLLSLPQDMLADRSKYFKICLSYSYNGRNQQEIHDLDLGKGRVNYLDYLGIPGGHIAHLKNHAELLKMCRVAREFAPDTDFGMEYEDKMQEWAGYCREVINQNSDHPVIPRPPGINRCYLDENRDWRLEL